MNNTIVQQAAVIQFNYQGHHQWSKCPLCLAVGPQREHTIAHLNKVHSMPGEQWLPIEAHDIKAGLNTFWVAVRVFDPTKVKQSTPEQDRKALESMKKAQVLPREIERRIEQAIDARKPPFTENKAVEKKEPVAYGAWAKPGKVEGRVKKERTKDAVQVVTPETPLPLPPPPKPKKKVRKKKSKKGGKK